MNFKRLKILRVAARVIRCHTTPTHHLQSVGEHTFGALNILYSVIDDPSAPLVRALLWHDVPEAISGDVPSPAKRYHVPLGVALDELEDKIIKDYALHDELTPFECTALFYCDLMDLAMFAAEEADMGNIAAAVLMRRALKAISKCNAQDISNSANALYLALLARCQTRYDHTMANTVINQWYDYDE